MNPTSTSWPSTATDVSSSTDATVLHSESRLKEGKKKRSKIRNTHNFFMQLSENERQLFAIVTEDISLQNTAGLQNIKRKLWKGRQSFKIMKCIFMVLQISLNVYTVTTNLLVTFRLNDMDHREMALTESSLEICSRRITLPQCMTEVPFEMATHSEGCFRTGLPRMNLMRVIVACEALLVLSIVFGTVWSSLYLIVCRDPKAFAKRRYFALIALPKLGAKISLISFLHYANVDRLKSFIIRGEFRCLVSSCCNSSGSRVKVPRSRSLSKELVVDDEEFERPPRFKHASTRRGCYKPCTYKYEIMGMLVCGFLVICALQALLVKLLMLYFASMYSFETWNYQEWLLFMGFVNQLGGLSMSSEVETLRVLIFKFGGEKTRWGSIHTQACETYFRYLGARTVEQAGRLRALALMWTMTSADLQRLFQGHQRLHEQAAVRRQEMEMFEKLKSREELIDMRRSLMGSFQDTQDRLPRLLNAATPDCRLEVLNELQTKAVGELRLAARVQEHIWEWTKVGLLEGDDELTADLRLSVATPVESAQAIAMDPGDLHGKASETGLAIPSAIKADSSGEASKVVTDESSLEVVALKRTHESSHAAKARPAHAEIDLHDAGPPTVGEAAASEATPTFSIALSAVSRTETSSDPRGGAAAAVRLVRFLEDGAHEPGASMAGVTVSSCTDALPMVKNRNLDAGWLDTRKANQGTELTASKELDKSMSGLLEVEGTIRERTLQWDRYEISDSVEVMKIRSDVETRFQQVEQSVRVRQISSRSKLACLDPVGPKSSNGHTQGVSPSPQKSESNHSTMLASNAESKFHKVPKTTHVCATYDAPIFHMPDWRGTLVELRTEGGLGPTSVLGASLAPFAGDSLDYDRLRRDKKSRI